MSDPAQPRTLLDPPHVAIDARCDRIRSGTRNQVCGALVWGKAMARGIQSCYGHTTGKEAQRIRSAPWYVVLDAAACWSWDVAEEAREMIDAPGLTEAQLKALLKKWHQGRCAVCGDIAEKLVLDHDHATNLVRGYLCVRCNGREGRAGFRSDDIYVQYRTRNPATMLGLTVKYR